MVFQISYTMTLNLILLLCLVAVINNLVTLSSARHLKNSSNEKEVIGSENGGDQVDPSKSNKAKMELDENQFPPFPFPFPFSPSVPQIPGFPMPTPVPGLPFPTPFDIPRVPPLPTIPLPPFPPLNIPGVPSLPVPSPPI